VTKRSLTERPERPESWAGEPAKDARGVEDENERRLRKRVDEAATSGSPGLSVDTSSAERDWRPIRASGRDCRERNKQGLAVQVRR